MRHHSTQTLHASFNNCFPLHFQPLLFCVKTNVRHISVFVIYFLINCKMRITEESSQKVDVFIFPSLNGYLRLSSIFPLPFGVDWRQQRKTLASLFHVYNFIVFTEKCKQILIFCFFWDSHLFTAVLMLFCARTITRGDHFYSCSIGSYFDFT